jgi:hypothetical protein
MNDAVLNDLRAKVGEPPAEDKVLHEKRLKAEILLIREHAAIASERKGHLVCEGGFGRVVVNQKEVTLYDLLTNKPVRNEPFKSHLYAVHRALCWSVLGVHENRFGNLQ